MENIATAHAEVIFNFTARMDVVRTVAFAQRSSPA
jgi:hypothetical protein